MDTHDDVCICVEPIMVGGLGYLTDVDIHAPVVRPVVCPARPMVNIDTNVRPVKYTDKATIRRRPLAFAAAMTLSANDITSGPQS